MPKSDRPKEPTREDINRRSLWPWLLAIGGALVIVVGLLVAFPKQQPENRPGARTTPMSSSDGTTLHRAATAAPRVLQRTSDVAEPRPAEEILAGKVRQFAASRRAVAHRLAQYFKTQVPSEVERFFNAAETGNWNELDAVFKSLAERRQTPPRSEDLDRVWRAIVETHGAAHAVHHWPAQKLLDYGNAVLGSLRPGMVYIGGTDPGCFIPTFLNETSEGERHIVFTQNALADKTYLEYINFIYDGQFAALTADDSQQAFKSYSRFRSNRPTPRPGRWAPFWNCVSRRSEMRSRRSVPANRSITGEPPANNYSRTLNRPAPFK